MKTLKRITIILVSVFMTTNLLSSRFIVNAMSTITEEESISEFMSIVKKTNEYQEYEGKIEEVEVMEYSKADTGDRLTISFKTGVKSQRLIFVGNIEYEVLYIGLITDGEDLLVVHDLLESQKISYSRTSLKSFTPDPNCSTFYCTNYQSNYTWNPQPSCSFIVGQSCNPLLLLPTYGWVVFAVCKVGVYVGCNYTSTKKCTAGFWNNVSPM